jgi:hypothetical protein
MKALAAVIADFLMNEAGWKKRRACSWVSDKLHRHGFARDDGKPITYSTVEEWRDVAKNASAHDPLWLLFKDLRQDLGAQCNTRWRWARISQGAITTSSPSHETIATRFLAEFVPLLTGIKNPENPTPFSG